VSAIEILTLPAEPDSVLANEARLLFRDYRAFLEDTRSCGTHIPKLDREIEELPTPYASFGGDVLLAQVDGQAAACIAYRATPDAGTCEIKRLFVRPTFRGLGLARQLVLAAIEQAKSRGYTRAILDTDANTMPSALALYLSLGFRPYMPDQGNLSFLELRLV